MVRWFLSSTQVLVLGNLGITLIGSKNNGLGLLTSSVKVMDWFREACGNLDLRR